MSDLKGKVAIVTGGGGVLGGNISGSLVKAGVNVVILDIRQENIDRRVAELSPYGEIAGFTCNVLDTESLESVKKKILERWDHIDILVNAAGGNLPGATLREDQTVFDMKVEDLNRVIDLNMYGSVYPCLVFGKAMAEQKYGVMINVSSMATYSAITRVLGYSMAKSSINIFTQWMAMEMALKFSDKIRVNAIAPGYMDTEMNVALTDPKNPKFTQQRYDELTQRIPAHRWGTPDDMKGCCIFLASHASDYLGGAIIPVDGGYLVM